MEQKTQRRLFPLGVGSRFQLNFFASGNASSHIAEHGQTIAMCRLDNILFGELPNYIKLDIEGFEMEALIGMKEIITREHPVLAVSVYHNPQDLFSIPHLLIKMVQLCIIFPAPTWG